MGRLTPFTRPADHSPVTMLELFFDLVFVFGATQVSLLIESGDGLDGFGRASLVLLLTWWIYVGYAWLANNVPPTTTATRLPMLLAMGCFLAMGASTQTAFGSGAWIFASAYLVVVIIHAVQFTRSSMGGSARAIRGIAPINFGAAALLFVGAAIGPEWGWVAWVAAVVLVLASFGMRRADTFTIRPAHFAERHALLVIIALGETILTTGASTNGLLGDPLIAVTFAVALVMICGLWWIYFGVDDRERALAALEALPEDRRTPIASRAYSLVHLLHVAGLVLVAVGLHHVLHDPAHSLEPLAASGLAAGFVLYFGGQAAFRRILRFASPLPLLVGVGLALASIPAGVFVSGIVQAVVLAVIAIAVAAYLQRAETAAVVSG